MNNQESTIKLESQKLDPLDTSKLKKFVNRYLLEIIGTSVIVSLLLLIGSIGNSWLAYRGFNEKVKQQFIIKDLSGNIVYLDEVLTMSAKMAATTGDRKWETRYNQFVDPLDQAIKQVIKISPDSYKEYGKQTDAANLKLVEMETKAFELVRQGEKEMAFNLLLGKEYEAQKEIYSKGIEKTIKNVEKEVDQQVKNSSNRLLYSLIFSAIALPISILAWACILLMIKEYIRKQNQAQQELITTKNELLSLNEQLENRSTDLSLREQLAQEQTEILETEIGTLLEVISSVEQGDFTVQAEVNEGITGLFADTLNRLIEGLSSIMVTVLQTTQEVTYRALELQDLAITTTEQAQQQVQSVSEVEALTQYVAGLSQTNLEQAIASNKVVQQTRASVLLGQQEMSEMTAGIVSLGEGSEQIVKRLEVLQEFVELANQFSKEQKRVAALTKVLAFNASMTASRASEQQDSEQFATVAKEFETIASQINELATQTNNSLILLQQRADQIQSVVLGISDNVREITQLVRDFTVNVSQSNQVFDNIKLVTEQLTQVEQEINQSSKSIATAAETTLKAMSAISKTARDTEQQATITRQQSEIMGQLAEKLLQMVKFFRVPPVIKDNKQ